MSTLAVITPSYAPDAGLFAELHRSVLEFTPDDTVHHVIVPRADRDVFARYAGPRCRVVTEPEVVPRHYLRLPRGPWGGLWANLRRPWPPVRGWVIQQAIKLAVAGAVEADVVLIADSDIVLIRPTTAARFTTDGRLRLHRVDDAVHPGMPRHVRWHQVARDLLGLPPAPAPPLHDYVTSLNFWDPAIVRDLQRRIADSTGRPWFDAFTAHLHVSEFILYGVFVDEVLGTRPPSDTTICHNSWEDVPMDLESALAFADGLKPEAVGMMISAKSKTPPDVRRAALDRCSQIVQRQDAG
ncbi:hypothetical protein HII36_11810 [Nonomuraea sp. NN258]|uniref:DUF6492 family protein n=1 Tax=Nonomuraea antri TaxID=2730852 RepID=UPI001569C5B8|nr:DUF6492 family protein [Nonomuraea antri]NRQ32519.1 hypothetical protein [Nonomuraea antri]